MEYRCDVPLLEVGNQGFPLFHILCLDVEHVGVVGAFFRNVRKLDDTLLRQILQAFVVARPALKAILVNLIRHLQLCH